MNALIKALGGFQTVIKKHCIKNNSVCTSLSIFACVLNKYLPKYCENDDIFVQNILEYIFRKLTYNKENVIITNV